MKFWEKKTMTEYSAEEYLDEKFPKGKSKLRGEAMVLLALAKQEEQERILQIINRWLIERTYQTKKELPALIKFMPFEWDELKAKIKEKK